jgi:hypothetical protein
VTFSFGAGDSDAFLLKYDSSGNLLWYKTWGGSGSDSGYGVALDASGNAFITGYTRSYGAGSYDTFLLKYDSSGNLLWNKTWGGSGSDSGYGVALDDSGNALITGETNSYGAGNSDDFLLKYDSSGNLLWYKTWGGSGSDSGYGVALDDSGNALITGETNSYGAGSYDTFLLKYDSSGNLLWYKTWGGSGSDYGEGIALDASGNAFITGYTDSYGAGNYDVFLLKYGVDTDNDGLSDVDEVNIYLTDPNNADTDGDGQNDGDEIALGFDPNNPFSNLFITILIVIIILIAISSVTSLTIIHKRKRKKSLNYTLISEIEAKIKEGEELKVKGELEKALNIFNEQLLSSKKLYDYVNKEKVITKIKNLIDETMVLTIEENIKHGEQLNKEGNFINAINKFEEQLENTKSISKTSRREKIREKVRENLIYSKTLKIKSIIRDLGSKHTRLQVMDIVDKCGEEEGLIISTIQDMIKNREISAEYFKSSKSIAFIQQIDVEEIDELMKSFDEWEKEGKGKKK